MASAWIRTRTTKDGSKRHRVEYRVGGRESVERYGGTFKTRREALIRKAWVLGGLAARPVPDLDALVEKPSALTLTKAGERWDAGRFDVGEATRVQQRTSLKLALPLLGKRRVDEIRPQDIA